MPTPYYVRLRELRQAKGLSQAELFRRTEGVGFDTIRALEHDPTTPTAGKRSRARYPSPATLEALAKALDVDPAEFIEYRLAKAREELDERIVGLDAALAHQERIVTALRQQAVRRRATEGVRRERRRQGPPSNRDEAASGEGA